MKTGRTLKGEGWTELQIRTYSFLPVPRLFNAELLLRFHRHQHNAEGKDDGRGRFSGVW